jgi:hypothetical protein
MIPIMAICFQLIIVRSSWLHNGFANLDITTTAIIGDHDPRRLHTLELRTVRRTPHARGISALTTPELEDGDNKASDEAFGPEDRVWKQSTMPKEDSVIMPTSTTHGDDVA